MFVTLPSRVRSCAAPWLALAVIALTGCASGADQPGNSWGLNLKSLSVSELVTPYKPDLIQGNFVSREQVSALQKGMSRQQVQSILGTPLLTSAFHANRWDYVFILERQGLERQFYKFAVFFDASGLYDRLEGDKMPTEAEFAARIDKPRDKAKQPVLEATEAQLQAFAPPKPAAAPSGPQGEPPASYPPLER